MGISAALGPDALFPGLVLVKSQTVGSAVPSVTVSDAFNATYAAYKIIWTDGVCSTAVNIGMQLGSSNTGYYGGILYISTGATTTPASAGDSNASSWVRAGAGDSNAAHLNIDVMNPNLARHTSFFGIYMYPGVPAFPGVTTGVHQVNTAYTSFTISPASGTLTGGTIRVYGYRN